MIKTLIVFILFSCGILINSFGQGVSPKLNLTGSRPSIGKGTIDTDVLLRIIQEKQEEVKRKVFRNTIVKEFNQSDYKQHLNNFATYYFMYNVMNELTSGKNKTAMTKSITEYTSEYAFLYAIVLYWEASKATTLESKDFPGLVKNVIEKAKANYEKKDSQAEKELLSDQEAKEGKIKKGNPEDFNLYIDLCFDILLKEKSGLHSYFSNFKFDKHLGDETSIGDDSFRKWFEADNTYLIETRSEGGNKEKLKKMREDMIRLMNSLATTVESAADTVQEINTHLDAIVSFYKDLKKKNFKDFSLTESQYDGMKYIIIHFLDLAKNNYDSDVVATVIEFLLENTIVEFITPTGEVVNAEVAKPTDKKVGYLSIDVESTISAIHDKFLQKPRKRVGVYIQPFLIIGTNYAGFPSDNQLGVDSQTGEAQKIYNLYFASEKIGFRYKIWNWKYTRSFGAGENFKYYNREGKSRYWLRPQERPTVSDINVILYGSGLLYNLADLKSENDFNYAIAGAGLGVTFFNGLEVTVGAGIPYTSEFDSTNSFYTLSIDIPLIEYIGALRNKE